MGVSTNAMLVFGTPVGDEDETPEFLRNPEYDEDDPDSEEFLGFEEFIASKEDTPPDNIYTFARTYPLELEIHCSGSYPMYILTIRGLGKTAYRGDVVLLDEKDLARPPEDQIQFLMAFCEKYGIIADAPQWCLVSYWSS